MFMEKGHQIIVSIVCCKYNTIEELAIDLRFKTIDASHIIDSVMYAKGS